jgi:hypothetical protein
MPPPYAPPVPPNSVPRPVKDRVPSEYAYSDGLVADTDGAHDAASLLCFPTTAALRSRVHGISATYDETREGPRMAWDEWEQLKTAAAER